MIPAFTATGVLPPGVHPATIDEINVRFGQQSELRRVQMESVRWMIDLARAAGVKKIILNGSFVTDIIEPNDVDCVLLIDDKFSTDPAAEAELRKGLPFLDIALVRQDELDLLVDSFFAYTRKRVPKGLVEVISWT